jgi:glycerophosphoryl diester phosphodiesterase
VELGTKNASSLEPTIALVNRYQSTKRFLVTSFLHPLVLDLVNRTSAEGGLLVAHRPLNNAALRDWTAGNKRLTTLVWDYDACDGDLMARSAAQGFRNFVYGAHTVDDHQCLRNWVVDGAITAYPQYLRTAHGQVYGDADTERPVQDEGLRNI